uniref:Uncharacterized protein n=1 Tax=Brassica campestris TaxID=3711 RepID=A0A3P6AAB3_BRACM|nr:unnamed protein product [Brassica rapa]
MESNGFKLLLPHRLVDEGRSYFHQIKQENTYNHSPKLEHYGCLIDLLCRAGFLDEESQLVKTQPLVTKQKNRSYFYKYSPTKNSIFGAIEFILEMLLEMEFKDIGVYVLLSNIFCC